MTRNERKISIKQEKMTKIDFFTPHSTNTVFRPAPSGFLAALVKKGIKMLRRPFCIKIGDELLNLKHNPV